MKCLSEDCSKDPIVHVFEVKDRAIVRQWDVCEDHVWTVPPYCNPGGGITSLGNGVTGGINTFELTYVSFLDKQPSDSLFFEETTGIKRFSIPVCRHQAFVILETLKGKCESFRPFTFTAFAMILQTLNAKIEEIVIDQIEGEGEFYHTKVKIRCKDLIAVLDIRPTDAFGLAIAFRVPILIADDVLARAAELGWTK